MVQFNNLEFITPKSLRVNAEVLDLDYFASVYIDSIIIDTEDTVCETGPSDNPPFVLALSPTKSLNTIVNVSTLVENGPKMLFVYLHCTGAPYPEPPCGLDKQDTMKPVVDYASVYEEALKLARCVSKCGCLDGNCTVDTAFANFSLQYFRLVSALENNDVRAAYDAWFYLLHKGGKKRIEPFVGPSKPCGCNG